MNDLEDTERLEQALSRLRSRFLMKINSLNEDSATPTSEELFVPQGGSVKERAEFFVNRLFSRALRWP